MMREEYGKFYNVYSQKPARIYIYGTAIDGVTYAKYLKKNKYNLVGFIDGKTNSREPILGLPVFKIVEVKDEYCYIILSAKTQSVALEMLDNVNRYLPRAMAFDWKAWCIDPRKMGGVNYCSIMDFPKYDPWMYCDIYGEEKDARYYEEVYLPALGPVMKGVNGLSDSYYCMPEYHSKYWNIDSEGRREYKKIYKKNKIVFVGDSRILGIGVEDNQTIPAYLQDMLLEGGHDYSVENYSVTMTSLDNILARINSLTMSKGDILCFSMGFFQVDIDFYEKYDLTDSTDYYIYRLRKMYDRMKHEGVSVFCLYSTVCEARKLNTLAEKTYIEAVKFASHKLKFLHYNRYRLDSYTKSESFDVFDMDSVVEKHHLTTNFYVDRSHYTPKGNKLIAEALYDCLFKEQTISFNQELLDVLDRHIDNRRIARIYPFIRDEKWKEYEKYLLDNSVSKCEGEIGAIVMNANPFSKGHQYLIEYASKKVDYLYVFVVEENCSEFSFEDRYSMVKLGTTQFSNVKVLKGGNFIISQQTFPEYFDRCDAEVDTSKDIGIFCQLISPLLGIKYRFVGKEPYSVVTRGYNNQMKEILPQYGMECIEIDRIDVDGELVSATKIRKALEDKDDELLRKMLPVTSYQYLNSILFN